MNNTTTTRRTYREFTIAQVGLGRVWYVYTADGLRYDAQFRTPLKAVAWIDSGMKSDWMAQWRR